MKINIFFFWKIFFVAARSKAWISCCSREAWMSVCCGCCVLSHRGLCGGPIPLPEESYRMCLCVCVLWVWSGATTTLSTYNKSVDKVVPRKERKIDKKKIFFQFSKLLPTEKNLFPSDGIFLFLNFQDSVLVKKMLDVMACSVFSLLKLQISRASESFNVFRKYL